MKKEVFFLFSQKIDDDKDFDENKSYDTTTMNAIATPTVPVFLNLNIRSVLFKIDVTTKAFWIILVSCY